MSKIKELRQQAQQITAEASALLESVTPETAADAATEIHRQFDELMERRDGLAAEADRLEALDRAKEQDERYVENREREDREQRRPGAAGARFVPQGDPEPDEDYRAAFADFLRSGGDTSAMEPEARGLIRARAQEVRAQTTLTGAAGGYTVPTLLSDQIIVAMAASGPMYDGAVTSEIVTDHAAIIDMPTVDDTDETASQQSDGTEFDDVADADVVIGKSSLGAYQMMTPWIKWSIGLAMGSGYSWEALLARITGERLGRKCNADLTTGTGTNAPLGAVTGASVGHTAAAQGAITADDLVELQHSVDPFYRNNPRVHWQMHDDTVKLLRKLKDADGRPLWYDGDLTKGIPAALMNKPVKYNQAMAVAAASADAMMFGDFGEYYVRKAGGIMIAVAREKFAPSLGIAGVALVDGAYGAAKAVKKLRMAAA